MPLTPTLAPRVGHGAGKTGVGLGVAPCPPAPMMPPPAGRGGSPAPIALSGCGAQLPHLCTALSTYVQGMGMTGRHLAPPPSPELSLRPSTRRGGQVGSLGSLHLRWGRGSSAPSPSLGCSPAAPWVWDGGALCFLAAKGGTGCGGRVLRCTRIPLPIGRSRPLWPLLWLIHGWGMPRGCRWGAGGGERGGVI